MLQIRDILMSPRFSICMQVRHWIHYAYTVRLPQHLISIGTRVDRKSQQRRLPSAKASDISRDNAMDRNQLGNVEQRVGAG